MHRDKIEEFQVKKSYEVDDTLDFNIKNDIGVFLFAIFFWTISLLVSAFILGWEISSITWKQEAVHRGFAIQNDKGFQWIR